MRKSCTNFRMTVSSFVAAHDFTGKRVVRFCTSSGFGLDERGELPAEEAGTGNWLTGECFSSGTSEGTVREWIEGVEMYTEKAMCIYEKHCSCRRENMQQMCHIHEWYSAAWAYACRNVYNTVRQEKSPGIQAEVVGTGLFLITLFLSEQ